MSAKRTKLVHSRLNPKINPKLATRKRLQALSEAELEAVAQSDPDAQPLTDAELAKFRPATPARLRRRLGMTQKQFADAFELPVATVRDWEQGRYRPDAPGRALLKLIAAAPAAALKVLGQHHGVPEGLRLPVAGVEFTNGERPGVRLRGGGKSG